ncbi:aldehyde dehydrogenase family protein [Kibdelosporangium philippinense]|uniref:Aldehyde dehydrogenase family protein n=1 Tax=Kibdelosporangium philippinense TaxID=211113 RepID=A0ABS8Z3K2_9PSEU|nr:aldehyde dehydrogenase family protein [Kibdelosporangium philippinense]MCE7002042.1 aldehyde dehydrogenase family protein [Kibdelosporangium philippinense]
MATATMSVARHWIDGEWVDSGEHRNSVNPATGEVIGSFAMAGAQEAQTAIDVAHRAFRESGWRTDRLLRARVLNRMADRFEQRTDELVELLGRENGKTHDQGRLEVAFAPETLRFNAALALTDLGTNSQVTDGEFSLVVRQPMGVAGIIAPWNSPVALGIRSLGPALAAGCTAVMNLPYQTAQINSLIAEIVGGTEELPPGVVNTITGGHVSGDVLVRSPDVPTISFTGSTATGKQISATAAANLKRLGLELGGKTPLILFEDADLDHALPIVVNALIVFAGQFCMTGSRLLVHERIADHVRTELAARLEVVKVGPAADPASEMGPIIDKANVERIDKLVRDAIDQGAKVIVRGGPISEGPLAAGAFYRPTLLEVEDSSMPIVQEEVFGPVLTMQTFATEAEAIALANDSQYGLSASVFSRDVDVPMRVAFALESGSVWVNDWAKLHDQFEEGGFKASGVGRMRGLMAIEDFVEAKHIRLQPGVTPVG